VVVQIPYSVVLRPLQSVVVQILYSVLIRGLLCQLIQALLHQPNRLNKPMGWNSKRSMSQQQ
jgi:hypothetical protein